MPFNIESLKAFATPKRIGMLAGAAAGGYLGLNRKTREDEPPGGTARNTILGIAAGATIGWGVASMNLRQAYKAPLGRLGKATAGATTGIAKALAWNPMAKSGYGFRMGLDRLSKIPGGKGVLGGLALLVGSAGAIEYGAMRPKPVNTTYYDADRDFQADPDRYNVRDNFNGMPYSKTGPVRRRMGMMGATGDMVFGLNNSRHG